MQRGRLEDWNTEEDSDYEVDAHFMDEEEDESMAAFILADMDNEQHLPPHANRQFKR